LVLRIGVTGHRLDITKDRPAPNEAQLRRTVREILITIADAVQGVTQAHRNLFDASVHDNATRDRGHQWSGPNADATTKMAERQADRSGAGLLRIVSAIAEGADQWVADEAVKLGHELQCPLPFAREEYEKDFDDPAVKAEFHHLLSQATAVFELDGKVETTPEGKRKPTAAAYEAVGLAVLNQTDLLLAIWDGQPPHGPGGTGAVVIKALERGIPVVWVSWSSPDRWVLRLPEWRLIKHPADLPGDTERLKDQVHDLLLPPKQPESARPGRSRTHHEEYFAERQKRGALLLGWWTIFSGFLSGQYFERGKRAEALRRLSTLQPFRTRPFVDETVQAWTKSCRGTILDPQADPAGDSTIARRTCRNYLEHYAWANQLSLYYGHLYRSAFVTSYLLGALAILAGLIGIIWSPPNFITPLAILEGAALITILSLIFPGKLRHWHERWIDYRTLAERLRLARSLSLLGGGGQQVSLAGHLATYGNPAATWMHWHYLNIERSAGLPNARLTEKYLERTKEFLLKCLVDDQIDYHATTWSRSDRLDRSLHFGVSACFVITLCACIAHLVFPHASRWLPCLSTFPPALAAAMAGIRSQAEVQRVARRSDAMQEALEGLKVQFASVPTRSGEGNSQQLRRNLEGVTELMIREMLDWRVVLADQPLEVHA